MIRTLTSPRWIAGAAVAVIFALTAIWLGSWQFDRHQVRAETRDRIEANYDGPPVPLDEVLVDGALPAAADWTRVEFAGEYLTRTGEREVLQLFARNRPYRQTFGYHLAAIALREGEPAVLVDRGWIPYGADAATLPEIDPLPAADLTIRGWVRPSEGGFDRTLPDRQLTSLSAQEAQAQLSATDPDIELLDVRIILEVEIGADGEPLDRPQAPDPPDTGTGSHLAYALQWWIASPIGLVLVWVFARREHLESLESAHPEPDADPEDDTDSGARVDRHAAAARPASTGTAGRTTVRREKKRKHRIWDDEDE